MYGRMRLPPFTSDEIAVITCSGHQWCYDLRDGRGINPRTARLRALPVRVQDGTIWVDPAHEPVADPTDRPCVTHEECPGE